MYKASEAFLTADLGEPAHIKNIKQNKAKKKTIMAILRELFFERFLNVHANCSEITITGIVQNGVRAMRKFTISTTNL